MPFRVLFDACVLAPYELSNVLLKLAEADLYKPLWSQQIIDETTRAMINNLGVTPEKAHKRIGAMTGRFPDAMIGDYHDLIRVMRNHRKDRHVLAAAVRGDAQLLITGNLKDFPQEAADPYDVEILNPDAFLSRQLDLDADTTMRSLETLVEQYRSPRMTLLTLMVRLRAAVPNFAQYVGSQLMRGEPVEMSGRAAAVVMSDPEEASIAFVAGPDLDLTEPREVGYGWNIAVNSLPEYQAAFENLCLDPRDWRDPQAVANELTQYGFMSGVDYAIEAPDRIAFMRYSADLNMVGQVFEAGMVRGPILIMTLVKAEADQWRVFALGPDYPYAADVLRGWSPP